MNKLFKTFLLLLIPGGMLFAQTNADGSVNTDGLNASKSTPPTASSGPMTVKDYDQVRATLKSAETEEKKVVIARDIATTYFLTAEQVERIVLILNLETSKLEIAKLAYAHTLDKNNYSKVYEAFKEPASATELNNYISSYKDGDNK